MARVKATLLQHPSALEDARRGPRFRRRFAALTRAMRSRIDRHLSERRPRRVSARAASSVAGTKLASRRAYDHTGTLLVAAAEFALDRVGHGAESAEIDVRLVMICAI